MKERERNEAVERCFYSRWREREEKGVKVVALSCEHERGTRAGGGERVSERLACPYRGIPVPVARARWWR